MEHSESKPTCVLIVEDNKTHVHLIRQHLKKAASDSIALEHVDSLEAALKRLEEGDVDALLLDLSLPDSDIEETLPRVVGAHADLPVIVLTSLDDLDFATSAVAHGAQDFLVKSDLSGPLLRRSISYAIERKKTQEQLESYAAELESSNEQLKNFAHTVAHEVKSPLTVVSACLQMFEHYKQHFDHEGWQYVEDAVAALRNLTGMVNDLLEFSQVGSGNAGYVEVDLEAVFYQAYVCLRPAVKETGAEVTHDPLPTITGNEDQLRQLLLNLIGNGIKYSGEGPPQVHVACAEEDEQWRFTVTDNESGIAPEDHLRIFEAFVRVHDQAEQPGSGIGLALCKRIVRNHEGEIGVQSEIGKGSTFWFIIPKLEPGKSP